PNKETARCQHYQLAIRKITGVGFVITGLSFLLFNSDQCRLSKNSKWLSPS
ncbi:uncharacterized protein METZ01_LOCUS87123, partial [marine metagenome]